MTPEPAERTPESPRERTVRRLSAFVERHDVSGLLEPDADKDVLRLVQNRDSGTDDDRIRVGVLNLVAWFHYCRASATGQPPDGRDHRVALRLFGLLGMPARRWRRQVQAAVTG